jgi:hypothetical protein
VGLKLVQKIMCVGIATATTPKKSNTKGINLTSYEDRPLWYQSMNRQSSEAKDKGQTRAKSKQEFIRNKSRWKRWKGTIQFNKWCWKWAVNGKKLKP